MSAQPTLVPGDVLLTSEETNTRTIISVFARDGSYKGELARLPYLAFSDLFDRDGVIYAAAFDSIQRISATGQLLTPFATNVEAHYLSPGPAGGIVTAGPAVLTQIAADGSVILSRLFDPSAGGGIDLGSDRCTLVSNRRGAVGRWNACTDTAGATLGEPRGGGSGTIRILPDGTFLVAVVASPRVLHLDANGEILRDYGIASRVLALDIDGTSFWAYDGCLKRIDIASGTVLTMTCPGGAVTLTVVGEPRAALAASAADVPAMTVPMLALLCGVVVGCGLLQLRQSLG